MPLGKETEYLLKTKNPSPKARSRYPPLVVVRKRKLGRCKKCDNHYESTIANFATIAEYGIGNIRTVQKDQSMVGL